MRMPFRAQTCIHTHRCERTRNPRVTHDDDHDDGHAHADTHADEHADE